jgi:GST-like protein
MIKFYYHPSPNPAKVALFLEESGLPYEVVTVDTLKGEAQTPGYLAINPNGKVPALSDGDAVLFDSSAILLYLGEKTGQFMSDGTPEGRARLYSWLMLFATGVAPFSGQAVHFNLFAPEPKAYALNRYSYEAERHWKLLDAQLAKYPYVAGNSYSIVDMSVWAWARMMPRILGEDALDTMLPNVKRLLDEVNARDAVRRVDALAARYSFKHEFDQEAMDYAFPQNKRLSESAAPSPRA